MKYSPEALEAFTSALKMGCRIKIACGVIGISDETYYNWCKQHLEFLEAVKKAKADAIHERLAIIRRAGIKSWQACAWWLERTYPDQYGLKTQVTSINTGDEDAQLKERAKRLTKRMNEIIEEHVKVLATAGKNGTPGPEASGDSEPLPHSNGNGSEPKQDIVLE